MHTPSEVLADGVSHCFSESIVEPPAEVRIPGSLISHEGPPDAELTFPRTLSTLPDRCRRHGLRHGTDHCLKDFLERIEVVGHRELAEGCRAAEADDRDLFSRGRDGALDNVTGLGGGELWQQCRCGNR